MRLPWGYHKHITITCKNKHYIFLFFPKCYDKEITGEPWKTNSQPTIRPSNGQVHRPIHGPSHPLILMISLWNLSENYPTNKLINYNKWLKPLILHWSLCVVFVNLLPMMYTSRTKTKQVRVSRTALWKGLWTLLVGPFEEGKGSVQAQVQC